MAKRKTKESAEPTTAPTVVEAAPALAAAPAEPAAAAAAPADTVNQAAAEPAGPASPEMIGPPVATPAVSDNGLTPSDTVLALAAGAVDLVDPPATSPAGPPRPESAERAEAPPLVASIELEQTEPAKTEPTVAAPVSQAAEPEVAEPEFAEPQVARSKSRLAAAAARLAAQGSAQARRVVPADTATMASPRRFPLAASIAFAAAIGAVVGAFGGDLLRGANAESTLVNGNGEMRILRDGVARLQADMAELQASFDNDLRTFRSSLDEELTGIRQGLDSSLSELTSSAKATGDEINALGRRIDAAEQARGAAPQTRSAATERDPAAVDRDTVTAAIHDAQQQTRAFRAEPTPAESQSREAQASVVQGWQVVDVFRGRALVDGRRHGLFEVGPGAPLPGVGRVESIERRAGEWVVVTSAGVILSAPDARPRQN